MTALPPKPKRWRDGPTVAASTFVITTPRGFTFALVGSHTSTVEIGKPVRERIGCAGCAS